MNGWIKVHRKVLDHPMFIGRPDWLGAWIILIGEANYKDAHLARGELRMSQERMCKLFGWTRKRVRYFLDELCSNGMISRDTTGSKKGHVGARISICNYSKYQDVNEGEGQIGAIEGPHTERKKKEEVDSDPNGSLVDNEVADPDLLGDPIKSKKSKSQPIAEAYQAYNATAERCGLPQATSLSPNRRKSIGARLRECGWDGWQNMLANVERSAFLTGSNDREWRVDLDWLIKPANFTKVSEGKYGNGRHAENDPADDWAVVAEQLRQQGYSLEGFQ